jgi:sodium/potassium-transporting ATPase subunit alpha
MDEHKISISELYGIVKSSEKGLTSNEAKDRLEKSGGNILESKNKESAILKFVKQFSNLFALLLIFGSLLAFLAEYLSPGEGNLYIGIALGAVVLLNGIFTFIQEYQSEKIMESFRSMLPSVVDVLRDGKKQKINAYQIVPGDIIFLSEGEKVPADGRLIKHNAMKVDNSSITGESEPQLRKLECTHKNILESRNMIFSGSLIQSGNGAALIYATGMNTQIGKIVKLTKETKEAVSPLKKELRHFIKIISSIAFVLGGLFFVVSLLLGERLIGSLIFAIGIIVANVPEGLLPTVTLSLSIAAKKMAKNNALIKNLESVETLGSTTVICTDKTGTITENKMSVNTLMLNLEEKNVLEKGLENDSSFQAALKIFVLCNNARYEGDKLFGDPTETSLLEFSKKFLSIEKLCRQEKRVHESPFDSHTKRMISTNIFKKSKFAYMKGAPEVIITKCSHVLIDGKVKKIAPMHKETIKKHYEKIASRGERVLSFAYKLTQVNHVVEKDFIFVGMVGILDRPRKEIPYALQQCHRAGIKVFMITGDHSLTAKAIARQVGLLPFEGSGNVITGDMLDKYNDDELKRHLKKEALVFARTNPIQKLRIVTVLQSMGEVVTVTGDGVNDAPAIKNADMGVAMGLSGTEVAKEASDMVLLDDNFATIVKAIETGRTIYDNIKKFIAYILTSNVPEILPFIAFAIFNLPLAITVVLILAIDLGTDLIPALGLGVEKSEEEVMNKKPRSKDERLLTKKLLFYSYGIVGMIQAMAGFFSFFMILYAGGWSFGHPLPISDPLYLKAVTAFFASIVICQVADVMICRTRKQSVFTLGIFSNWLILLGIAAETILLLVIVYFPPANILFGTAPLSLYEISLSVPFALIILFGDELRKYFARRGNKFVNEYLTW